MLKYDDPQKYDDTLISMQNATTFQQRFGQHYLYQNNHWQQYAFHNTPDSMRDFIFLPMSTYSVPNRVKNHEPRTKNPRCHEAKNHEPRTQEPKNPRTQEPKNPRTKMPQAQDAKMLRDKFNS